MMKILSQFKIVIGLLVVVWGLGVFSAHQTKQLWEEQERSSRYEQQISQIKRANLLTETLHHYNAQIYQYNLDHVKELQSVSSIDDPLSTDLISLLERVRRGL